MTTIGRYAFTAALFATLSACAYESQLVCSPANPCPPPLPSIVGDPSDPLARIAPDAAASDAPTDAGTHD